MLAKQLIFPASACYLTKCACRRICFKLVAVTVVFYE
jgi:hypothetical protein